MLHAHCNIKIQILVIIGSRKGTLIAVIVRSLIRDVNELKLLLVLLWMVKCVQEKNIDWTE